MGFTVIVLGDDGAEASLTFDGIARVVIGRGASSDVRLPDASVSHRHASLSLRGTDCVVLDEGSTNGTFVGQVRVASHTSRVVRSGDVICVGRVSLKLRIDRNPVTRDAGAATREIALALMSKAILSAGGDPTMRVRVVEGSDQGGVLPLADEGRAYLVGREAHCDLPLSDADASREHAEVVRRGSVVSVRDLGAKNGTWLGEARVPSGDSVVWRAAVMMRIGRTVLALEDPAAEALVQVEGEPDAPVASVGAPVEVPRAPPASGSCEAGGPGSASPMASSAAPEVSPARRGGSPRRQGFSIADRLVLAAAICVLALSVASLVWLLRG